MAEWMTIRVVLADGQGIELDPPAGRIMLCHTGHTFAEFAEAVEAALGRWDPTPEHEFEVEGRVLASDPDALSLLMPGLQPLDSEGVTLGEVGLRRGARFTYLFDPRQRWVHQCRLEETSLDPFTLVDEEPDLPVPVFGWGDVPDQYGRIEEDDDPVMPDEELAAVLHQALADDDDLEVVLDLDQIDDEGDAEVRWPDPEPASWRVVEAAIAGIPREAPIDELRTAVDRLREAEGDAAVEVLWSATGLDEAGLPDSDLDLWVELAAGVVLPRDAVPMDAEDEEAWAGIEPADWAGAVIGLVRAGVGHDATPAALLELIDLCDEVDSGHLDEDDELALLAGFGVVMGLWRALGAVDAQGRLTALGHWGIPEGLRRAWT
jgi:hypothetical protein